MELWEEDLYELIGVSSEATPEEIKKAYKKLAIELHPDRYPNDEVKRAEATERFGRITNAYNVLKDEEERAEYDFARRMGFGASGGPGPAPNGAAGGAAAAAGPGRKSFVDDSAVNEAKRSQAENQFEQGKVYHKARNWQKAINCYKESIRLDATVADYHAHLGLAYKQQGLNSPANSAFAAAYKLDKKHKILKEHYEVAIAEAAKKGGKGKKDAKGGGLLDQIMAMFGGGKKDAKGKKGAPAKKGTAQLKKASAKK